MDTHEFVMNVEDPLGRLNDAQDRTSAELAAAMLVGKDPAAYPDIIADYADRSTERDAALHDFAQRMLLVTRRLIQRAIALPSDDHFADLVIIHNSEAWSRQYDYQDPPTISALDSEINMLLEVPSEQIKQRAQKCIEWLWSQTTDQHEPVQEQTALPQEDSQNITIEPDDFIPTLEPITHPRNTSAITIEAEDATTPQARKPIFNRPGTSKSRPKKQGNRTVNDLLRLYLDDIGEKELLTADQEKHLARIIQKGLAAEAELEKIMPHNQDSDSKPRKTAEQMKLERDIVAANEAREHFTLANMRLVVAIARRFGNVTKQMDMSDLITAGFFGLRRAIDKFDPDRGLKFSTYATWWIRQSVQREIAYFDRTVRLPVQILDEERLLYSRTTRFVKKYGFEPNDEQLITFSGGKITQKMIDRQRSINMAPAMSLDAPIQGSDNDELDAYDIISANQEDKAERQFQAADNTVTINRLIEAANLTERELVILVLRHGTPTYIPEGLLFTLGKYSEVYKTTEPEKFREKLSSRHVAHHIGMSNGDRIRAIERKALAKLLDVGDFDS